MADEVTKATIDPWTYRKTIGNFATGVTVIGTGRQAPFHGMTANAVTSLSLDPLLILFCVSKEAHCAHHVKVENGFSINVLTEAQVHLSMYFANMWEEDQPPEFEFLPWQGGPLLKGCGAAIGCDLYNILEGGDHWIVVGKVITLYRRAESYDPLIYYQGQYRGLAAIQD